jgi:NAD(P)-dependent dehydrogenase (short-subunit alcohol dehydrogenase family)
MMRQKKGSIINITSLSGQRGNAGQSAYAASKAAIVAFSKTIHKEMGSFGVTINCISPGLIRTDMTKDIKPEYYEKRLANSPLKRMGEPEEVANLITYIATSAPSYLIGQEITIDGGIGV